MIWNDRNDRMDPDDYDQPGGSYEPLSYVSRHEVGGSHVLEKASTDSWTYCVVLKSGLTIVFGELNHRDEFVHLGEIESVAWPDGRQLANGKMCYGRGMEVRISEIAAVIDQDS